MYNLLQVICLNQLCWAIADEHDAVVCNVNARIKLTLVTKFVNHGQIHFCKTSRDMLQLCQVITSCNSFSCQAQHTQLHIIDTLLQRNQVNYLPMWPPSKSMTRRILAFIPSNKACNCLKGIDFLMLSNLIFSSSTDLQASCLCN